MNNREIFIDNVNKFNKGNKYNFSQEILWAEEGLVLLEEPDKYKDQINFAVFDNDLIELSEEITCFQCTLDKHFKHDRQFALPYSFERIDEKFDVIKEDSDAPTVGFCGNYAHPRIRQETLFSLQKDERIKTDFIWRLFHNMALDPSGGSLEDMRFEFKENMKENIFNVCMRGNGNFSIRFYETLSCGRIPVLVDTDLVLPFDDVIDYNEFCVISKTIDGLKNDIIRTFNNGSYIEMQDRAYEVYQDYFHLDIVGKRIVEYLDRNL